MRRAFFVMAVLAIAGCASGERSSSPDAPAPPTAPCVITTTIGEGLVPRASNDRGVVVGNGRAHAFVWSGFGAVDLGTLGGAESSAVAVNASGTIVGMADAEGDADGGAEPHAVRWRDGIIEDLGTLGGIYGKALDVNDRGEIVGYAATADGRSHAFVWRDGVMIDLGTLGGAESGATRINERGQIIGWSLTAPPIEMHAFLWDAGAMIDLGKASGAIDVNERGDVILQAHDEAGFWRDGVLTVVAPFEDVSVTFLHAIDETGRVVGSTVTRGREVGFLWHAGVTTPIDVEGSDAWVTPIALNARGEVVGFAAGGAGGRAFYWSDGELRFLTGDDEDSVAVAIDAGGRIVGTSDGVAKLWEIAECPIASLDVGHEN